MKLFNPKSSNPEQFIDTILIGKDFGFPSYVGINSYNYYISISFKGDYDVRKLGLLKSKINHDFLDGKVHFWRFKFDLQNGTYAKVIYEDGDYGLEIIDE